MRFVCLIYEDEAIWNSLSKPETEAIMAEHAAFYDELVSRGQFVAGEALEPVGMAQTVRMRDGMVVKTDGPFAETKEQLGGFYVIEASGIDEATQIASRIPTARQGCIEVRPVFDFGE